MNTRQHPLRWLMALLGLTLVFGATGQVVFNDIRGLDVDSNTIITLDDQIITPPQLQEIIGLGYKGRFRVANDVNATVSTGTLTELHLIIDYKGIVTGLNPLRVMDQALLVTGDTVKVNFTDLTDLQPGDEVSVSGIIAADGSMQAGRVEKVSNPLSEWKVRGYLTAVNNPTGTVQIGGLRIASAGLTISDCPAALVVGEFVEIRGSADAAYQAGSTWQTASQLQCQAPDIDQDPDGAVPALVEGMVENLIDFSSFTLNELLVVIDGNTRFDNGELEHIDVGTKVEVQGILDSDNGILAASIIRFLNDRVKVKAAVAPADIVPGQSITLLGLTFRATPQTRDDEGILANGLTADRQVEVRGFVDDDGQLFALRVRDRGSPDVQSSDLRGVVTAVNAPLVEIQGVPLDTTGSELIVNDETVTAAVFFSMVRPGAQVEVDDATFDAVSGQLSGGTVELRETEEEDVPDGAPPQAPPAKQGQVRKNIPQTKEIIGLGFTGGRGVATVTRTDNIIYRASFD